MDNGYVGYVFKNYYDFVLVMEKLVVHNISIKTFQKDSLLIAKIERKDDLNFEASFERLVEKLLQENAGKD